MKNFLLAFRNRWRPFILASDSWIFILGLLCASVAITYFNFPASWSTFLYHGLLLNLVFCPLVILDAYLTLKRKKFKPYQYHLAWFIGFSAYLMILLICVQNLPTFIDRIFGDREYLITTIIVFFYLKAGLELDKFIRRKVPQWQWLKKMNLPTAAFIVLILFSVFWGLLALSNLDPLYQNRAIPINIDLAIVVDNFGTFLSLTAQFFLVYIGFYVFYMLNHHFLIPTILKKRGVFIYVLTGFGLVVLLTPVFMQIFLSLPISDFLAEGISNDEIWVFDIEFVWIGMMVIGVTLPVILTVQWFQQNNQIVHLEKEKVQTELDLLKQQINPHFFFNTLNNLYALSLQQSKRTPEVIMQLSELMHYVIYQGKELQVPILEEVKYIEGYLELQELRIHKNLSLKFTKGILDEEVMIPPLFFIVLVENAFKHGIEPAEGDCFLHIRLKTTRTELTFKCENSFEQDNPDQPGIGLENLRRRLALRYPGNHILRQEKAENVYKVELKIGLDEGIDR